MNRKASKVITSLLLLALLLSPVAILTTCRGSPARNIEDVSPGDWFYRYVVAGLRFGIIVNEGGRRFRLEPDEDITLGEFVTMLGRLHEYGHGTIGTPGDSPDYERYFEWAVERRIISTHLDWDGLTPDVPINREKKAVIVFWYIDVFDLHDYFHHMYAMGMISYGDEREISPWAFGQVMRLSSMLMVTARYGGAFKPQDPVTRTDALQTIIQIGSAVYDLIYPLR